MSRHANAERRSARSERGMAFEALLTTHARWFPLARILFVATIRILDRLRAVPLTILWGGIVIGLDPMV